MTNEYKTSRYKPIHVRMAELDDLLKDVRIKINEVERLLSIHAAHLQDSGKDLPTIRNGVTYLRNLYNRFEADALFSVRDPQFRIKLLSLRNRVKQVENYILG